MSDEPLSHKTADWAPGTLDKTRKAIGAIDPAEAAIMAKKLGGQVLNERSAPANASSHTSKYGPITGAGRSGGSSSGGHSSQQPDWSKAPSEAGAGGNNPRKHRKAQDELPNIPAKMSTEIDKLMMAPEYQIKPNYGFFNFIRKFQKNGMERVIPEFYQVTLKLHIDNMEAFITVIKTMIQIAPNTYKAKIANGTEAKFKFLRMVAGWKMQNIRLAYIDLQNIPPPLLVSDFVPLVREIYKPLMSVYYYGDTKIPKLIKEIYADEAGYPEAPREKLSDMAKQAITEWLYLDTEIIRKLYPMLMRMCPDSYEEYPAFFTSKVALILQFVGIHKFDLLLPDKPKAETAAQKPKQTVIRDVKGKRDEIVNTGIALLDRLFPQAGFKKLEAHPDMFPYFQPLYKFDDGFNMLSPMNPLQITVVLIRIIEDCFQGCRNIKFVMTDPQKEAQKAGGDSIYAVLDEWSAYRETVFEKLYCEPLRNFVNQEYEQSDFGKTQFGKKLLTSMLWQTTFHFLPAFKFEQLLLERPADESKVKPLFQRTDYVRNYLSVIVSQCDAASRVHAPVSSIQNPWEHYKFDIPNEVSKRLDVLLGAQNNGPNTNANNANLLKYTLCIVSVLDWWINNPDSPSYQCPPMQIYRVSEEDGKPQFSVPERTDQNKLFADEIKAAYTKQGKK
jgi:hypothetical protein